MIRYEMPKPWWINEESDYLKIIIKSNVLDNQKANTRSEDSIITKEGDYEWTFIAPNEIMEDVSHEWGEYENMSSRIANKIESSTHAFENLKKFSGALFDNTPGIFSKNFNASVGETLNSINIPRYKIDTPLIYQNSQRLRYNFTFSLVYTGNFSGGSMRSYYLNDANEFQKKNDLKNFAKNIQKTLYDPITMLEKLSCAEEVGDIAGINFPNIFKIHSEPLKMINIRHAAITAVQPTWKSPYILGRPIQCDLTITIMDLAPLYQKSIDRKFEVI